MHAKICMLALSPCLCRWCMLKVLHGQKRQTYGCETRTRKGAHRAAPAEGRASSGREGAEDDHGIGQSGRRSGYCPHQAWATAARRLAVRGQLEAERSPPPLDSLVSPPWAISTAAAWAPHDSAPGPRLLNNRKNLPTPEAEAAGVGIGRNACGVQFAAKQYNKPAPPVATRFG